MVVATNLSVFVLDGSLLTKESLFLEVGIRPSQTTWQTGYTFGVPCARCLHFDVALFIACDVFWTGTKAWEQCKVETIARAAYVYVQDVTFDGVLLARVCPGRELERLEGIWPSYSPGP